MRKYHQDSEYRLGVALYNNGAKKIRIYDAEDGCLIEIGSLAAFKRVFKQKYENGDFYCVTSAHYEHRTVTLREITN